MMETSRLPLSSSIRGKLISAGYTSLSSISSVSSTDLARDVNITEAEAFDILKLANQISGSNGSSSLINGFSFWKISKLKQGAKNAWDMLHEEESLPRITTSCSDLDSILGGGISCRDVTEIGGVPGIGKTQIGIQFSVNVQIPRECGGLGGKAIYIDTEGSFMVERALQIAEACVEDMEEYTGYMHKHFKANQVKVVIVDSITFHFRQDFDDLAKRTRVLSEMALKFMKLAKKFSLAVVLSNQVTTKYTEGSFQLALALGDSWSHSCTNRVILYWNGDERHAYIDKSPSLPSASASYTITSRGLRNSSSSNKRVNSR
ncbi:hypothetical protein EUTSA_v10001556mg [Eutrema salsugineum]|uniref:DNA repair protein RAD51 homolog 3 n=1 Tax=Eutrema salsugineum TaxID=72664 RepID=V4N252_EUTSA|nr:hypothetical protein EUTSA_v10001556mg [Eutrema salsugineum]